MPISFRNLQKQLGLAGENLVAYDIQGLLGLKALCLPIHDAIQEDGQGQGEDGVGHEVWIVVPANV